VTVNRQIVKEVKETYPAGSQRRRLHPCVGSCFVRSSECFISTSTGLLSRRRFPSVFPCQREGMPDQESQSVDDGRSNSHAAEPFVVRGHDIPLQWRKGDRATGWVGLTSARLDLPEVGNPDSRLERASRAQDWYFPASLSDLLLDRSALTSLSVPAATQRQ